MARERVAVALSGGVDSSVAACVLQEAGYEVIGVTMRLWSEETTPSDQRRSHYSARGIHDAEELCSSLGIPFHLINLEDEFKHYVIDYFCQEYARGRTPNPCVACNQYLKFGSLLDQALSLGANYLATGHYARIHHSDGTYHLLKGIDPDKDQSYILYTLGQGKLKHLLFPLGDYLKAQVRELAREKGLPTAGKPSSQDICFISGDYGAFLRHYSTTTSGEIVSQQGDGLPHCGSKAWPGHRRGRASLCNQDRTRRKQAHGRHQGGAVQSRLYCQQGELGVRTTSIRANKSRG